MYTLTLGFLNRTVAIDSDIMEIISMMEWRFRKMIVRDCTAPNGRIQVLQQGNGYYLDISKTVYSPVELQAQLEYHIMDFFVRSSPDFLWLHAGAVAKNGKGLLVSGPSGCGKSTLTLRLHERGWRFLSDDLLAVNMESSSLHAFLRTPWFREPIASQLPPDQIYQLKKREIELVDELIEVTPVAMAMLVFPVYQLGAVPSSERLSGASIALELAGQAVNFSFHGASALNYLSRIARNIPAYRIIYSNHQDAIKLAEDLWDRQMLT